MAVIPTRTVGVPIEHIDAELLAAPLASREAFNGTLIALDPRVTAATVPLWRETERDLLQRFPGMSVDELVARRDHTWFGQASSTHAPVGLAQMLCAAALQVLAADAGIARPVRTRERGEVDQRRCWRWLTFSLPPDLLLASVGASCERIGFLSHALQSQLERDGLAETHLHLKAALPFGDLWASLMSVLAEPDASPTMLSSTGAEWNEGRDLAPLLLQCALARLLIGAFLAKGRALAASFRDYVDRVARPGSMNGLGALQATVLWRAVVDLLRGRASPASSFAAQRHVYALLIGRARLPQSECLDPMTYWFAAQADGQPDFRLAAAAFRYIGAEGRGDELFARLFWQTVRGRVAFYRHVVQRPMVPGLQWFIRTYGRLAAPRRAVSLRAFVRNARRMAGPGLCSLEVRLSPDDRFTDLVQTVLAVDGAAREFTSEFGVVFHFSRLRGDAALAGKPAAWGCGGYDDPLSRQCNPSGYRFASYFRSQRSGAIALANLLHAYPRALEVVRGVDLCTDELGVPLWVLRPLVEHVVHAGHRAAAWLGHVEGAAPRALGLTIHAGEDFVHLLGGIRRLAEAVELLALGEGARLGHAVALGIDVPAWCERTGLLRVPRGERLLDLLWAWRMAPRVSDGRRDWMPIVEQELCRIGAELFGQSVSALELVDWWTALHDARCLRVVGFPDGGPRWVDRPGGVSSQQQKALRLVHQWLTSPDVFRRAQQLECIDTRREAGLTQSLQDCVRHMVAERSIVVEVNPSSNLLIGHLVDLTSHPLWRLAPPGGDEAGSPHVRVTIGSDDPITFATTLPDEYQLVADALSTAGVARPAMDQWLSAAQRCGILSRFTVPRSAKALRQPARFDPAVPL
jgi:hypothetical protein